jgi:hypothetical protein
MRIGDFQVRSGTLRVTDPCYSRDIDAAGVIPNAAVGTWRASVTPAKGYPRRVAALHADYLGHMGPTLLVRFAPKDGGRGLGVDSGQMGVFDDSLYPESTGEYSDSGSIYSRICEMTELREMGLVDDWGAVSSTGWGDGEYLCFLRYNKDASAVVGVSVVFMPEQFEGPMGEGAYDEED